MLYRVSMLNLLLLALALPQVQIAETLDDFHLAAAQADGDRYFAHFTEDAVFLGTDAGERWSLAQFRAYAEPHFSKGQGWTYVASERHIQLGADGKFAWFDECLQNEKYGEVRGSGVLQLLGDSWKIAQYNLTFPVPNDLAQGVVKKIAAAERVGTPRAESWVVEDGDRSLFVWNKVVPGQLKLPAEERPIVVFLPSASFSARASWDFPLRDYSVMEFLAGQGYDVFACELGGYGLSTPAKPNPIGGCESAQRDLELMVTDILKKRETDKIVLVGHSWGSQVAGRYAMQHPDQISGLVLYGFNWKRRISEEGLRSWYGEDAFEGPFRQVTREVAQGDFIEGFHEEDTPEAFTRHLLSQGKQVPSGALHDYASKLPLVDPAGLKMPTLMLAGRLEYFPPGQALATESRTQLREFYGSLPGNKHWIEIPGAGHSAHLDQPYKLFQRCLLGWIRQVK